jgi:hypothetical protein
MLNGSLQLHTLPTKYEKLKGGDYGESKGGPVKSFGKISNFVVARRFLLFVLVSVVDSWAACVGGGIVTMNGAFSVLRSSSAALLLGWVA